MKTETFHKQVKGLIDKDPEIIGYIMEKDFLVVTNPCKIPLNLLEEQIKENKKNPPKKNETKFIGTILLKLPLKDLK